MSLVGKKFPSIAVDAISEMGDNLKINIYNIPYLRYAKMAHKV